MNDDRIAECAPRLTRALARFARDETGATAIEYALVASLVCLAIVVIVVTLGETLADLYKRVASAPFVTEPGTAS